MAAIHLHLHVHLHFPYYRPSSPSAAVVPLNDQQRRVLFYFLLLNISLQWQRGTSWLDLGPYYLHTFNKKPQGCNYVPSYPLVLRILCGARCRVAEPMWRRFWRHYTHSKGEETGDRRRTE